MHEFKSVTVGDRHRLIGSEKSNTTHIKSKLMVFHAVLCHQGLTKSLISAKYLSPEFLRNSRYYKNLSDANYAKNFTVYINVYSERVVFSRLYKIKLPPANVKNHRVCR